MKRPSELELHDFDAAPVWRTTADGMVSPSSVDEIADHVGGLWVRFHGKLADETPIEGIARAECPPPLLHEHVFFVDGGRHALDFASGDSGPKTFAQNLNRTLSQTFPIWIRAEVKAECTGDVIAQELDVTGPAENS